jgi:hypothetical protein
LTPSIGPPPAGFTELMMLRRFIFFSACAALLEECLIYMAKVPGALQVRIAS